MDEQLTNSRRDFIGKSATLAGGLALSNSFLFERNNLGAAKDLSLNVFSKHLQFLDYKEMASAAAEMGFDGIDLTVRDKGHVLPERVEEDLPRAIEAIKNAGLKHDMMASNVNRADDPLFRKVLETAAAEGVKIYRMGYVSYLDDMPIDVRLDELNERMKDLAALNTELGITGAYQNHAGTRIGAEIWEVWKLLKGIVPTQIGSQYDIRHAVVEGGLSWGNSLRLIAPQINSIVLKDFLWVKGKYGKWDVKNVPLGQGMVDFPAYFKLLKELDIDVPVSVHYEYDLGGVEHGATELSGMSAADIFKAMKRDLQFARKTWKEA